MPRAKSSSITAYRKRMKRGGLVRLEVHVRKDDAPLLRDLVKALGDPAREADARTLLREHFGLTSSQGLKALLAAAPLEDIDLSRSRDIGRDVEL